MDLLPVSHCGISILQNTPRVCSQWEPGAVSERLQSLLSRTKNSLVSERWEWTECRCDEHLLLRSIPLCFPGRDRQYWQVKKGELSFLSTDSIYCPWVLIKDQCTCQENIFTGWRRSCMYICMHK